MHKLDIAILFGGNSSEHEISISSATTISENISKIKYNLHYLYISKDGQWYLTDGTDLEKSKIKIPATILPNSNTKKIVIFENNQIRTIHLDAVIPVLHGKNGEDGSIQGLLQLAQIPFVGCDLHSSSACMDKVITNSILMFHGINKAKFHWFFKYEFEKDPQKCLNETENKIKCYPMFVKPSKAGSSVGITKVFNREELFEGIKKAAQEDEKILIEESINGQEVENAVLGNDTLTISTVGEIASAGTFYDYESKYVSENSKLYIPANISENLIKEIQSISAKAYKIMGCKGLARIDYFVEKNTEKIFLNEINTFPGFTSISMYPKLMENLGITPTELIDKLINLAINNK